MKMTEGEDTQYMRGIDSCYSSNGMATILIGSSSGTIFVFANPTFDEIYLQKKIEAVSLQNKSITNVLCCGDYVISSNDHGDLHVYNNDEGYILRGTCIGNGSPCTSLVGKDDVIVGGFMTGHIRIYKASKIELSIEITANIKMITALAFHPIKQIIASVSEDQYLQLWDINMLSHVELMSAFRLDNKLCTGVDFSKDDGSCIYVASYEREDVDVFNLV